ncbi:MAG TPA: vanadium-dependent haloperoxidase [Xanthobacteraceae bacterium]|nr:vanadium-dependent haloperoxidase [Xanthobacteraceae bacterium]
MTWSTRTAPAIVLAAAFAALLPTPPVRADVVTDWNARAETIAIEKQTTPAYNARQMAILQVAVFEAVNAIERRYAPYRLTLTAERTLSKDAAAAAAAHAALVAFHPERQEALDAALAASLAAVPDGEAKVKGVALGKTAAAEMLALRAKDGADAPESYRPRTSPGVYVPTTIPVFSQFPAVTPWAMTSGDQFRPAAPPALDSEVWTKDLNEIRELGARNSTVRTAEQTTIGRFWLMTGPRSYNPIVRQLAAAKEMDIVDCARLLALVAMAGSDAIIAVMDGKYAYNFWRPLTAIRNADITGNAATPREASWLPLGDTPMHPEYPCAHCITSSAVGAVLTHVLGPDVPQFSLTSTTAPGVTRTWKTVEDYNEEVASARIYAGFHYRFSTVVGRDMGRRIGTLVASTQLRGATASAAPAR